MSLALATLVAAQLSAPPLALVLALLLALTDEALLDDAVVPPMPPVPVPPELPHAALRLRPSEHVSERDIIQLARCIVSPVPAVGQPAVTAARAQRRRGRAQG